MQSEIPGRQIGPPQRPHGLGSLGQPLVLPAGGQTNEQLLKCSRLWRLLRLVFSREPRRLPNNELGRNSARLRGFRTAAVPPLAGLGAVPLAGVEPADR